MAIQIEHPITGRLVDFFELAEETGLHENTLRKRYQKGRRGAALIEPVSEKTHRQRIESSQPAAVRRRMLQQRADYLASPAGVLATHLFRDYRSAR
ncbi:hypothetical protein QO259_17350 [Salinicola sp. JS01]|uniref:hypothetical protein n=1 Tax=Salinicola sp. JS01 TaxID=3050071 RepID=UPI00255B6A5C|nr:hypothetical protein [Salinicola sp. JS01]WIX32555.1 hypothetical protein QO259_17350 [Salinicola sp. JS01]